MWRVWRFCSHTRKRGDLGQLAPRKKLLKSFSSFPEDFLRPSEHFGTEGFSFSPPRCPNRIPRFGRYVILIEAKDLKRSVAAPVEGE